MSTPATQSEVTYRNYLIGFALSLVTTFIAYFMVTDKWLSGSSLLIGLGALAFTQMLAQLLFFLHLGEEKRPRLQLWSFGFMTIILLILVIGSLWVMHHLNYNMMDMGEQEKDHYMMQQKDKGF